MYTFHKDGNFAVGGGARGTLSVWQVEEDHSLTELFSKKEHFPDVLAVRVNQALGCVASGGQDFVKLWNIKEESIKTIFKSSGNCHSMDFKSYTLATGCAEVVKLWDVNKENLIMELKHSEHMFKINGVHLQEVQRMKCLELHKHICAYGIAGQKAFKRATQLVA